MNGVQHIAYGCVDRIAQEKFYTKHFGFTRARVFNAGEPGEFVIVRSGSVCLEFFGSKPDAGEKSLGPQTIGYKHLAMEVDDIEATVAELKAAGLEPGEIQDHSGVVEGLRICFLKDPEGNVLELMEGWQDQENPEPL